MEPSQTGESEDRIAALEQKLTNMEALVKGLLAELLDFKAVAMTMSRESAERDRQDLKRGPPLWSTPSPAMPDLYSSPSVAITPEGNTLIRPRGMRQPDVPVAPAEPEMVRIMQSDGTMKLEARYGQTNRIDSTGGYGRNRKDLSGQSNQAPLIYAAEDEKKDPANM